MTVEYLDATLGAMDGARGALGRSEWLRWCSDDVSDSGGEPRDGRPLESRPESRRESAGWGLAPPGLLTRLLRRSAR